MDGLMSLLTEDVMLQSDGGGRVPAARKPIFGRKRVAVFLVRVVQKAPQGLTTRMVDVNGQPGVGLYDGDRPTTILTLDVAGDRIQGVHIVANPEKLTRV
jgi:RNA polymerase sigma-70 factor (ECF subfamily)